jgi:hypothetical protein
MDFHGKWNKSRVCVNGEASGLKLTKRHTFHFHTIWTAIPSDDDSRNAVVQAVYGMECGYRITSLGRIWEMRDAYACRKY